MSHTLVTTMHTLNLIVVLSSEFSPGSGQTVERISVDKVRFFRVERTYAVKTGKWYFEFEAVTGGDMRVGWARPACKPDVELGTDAHAFVFDGYRVDLNSFLAP